MATFSIMRAVSMMDSEKVTRLPSVSQVEDLNLITPLSSMNVTPNEDEVHFDRIFCTSFAFFIRSNKVNKQTNIF